MNQWEGKDRRGRGRPTRADEAASIALMIRVTPSEKRALIAWATSHNADSLADFCRLILNEAAAEEGERSPLVA